MTIIRTATHKLIPIKENIEIMFKKPSFFDSLKLQEKNYIVLTMHRPANVDEELKLKSFLE